MEEYEEEVEMEEQEVEIVDQSTVADIDPPCEDNEMEERKVFLWWADFSKIVNFNIPFIV